MSKPVAITVVILMAVVLPILWFAFLHRIRAGRFESLGETESTKMFKTSLGTLRISRKHKRVQLKDHNSEWVAIAFDDIHGMRLEQEQSSSMFLELLTGFNVWDFWGDYRDQNITCKISLVTRDNVTVPVFFASQYEQREYWIEGMWLELTQSICTKLGLYKPVEAYSEKVFEDLQEELHYFGVTVPSC